MAGSSAHFAYKLTFDEAFEAFLLLAEKRSRRTRYILACALMVLAAAFVVAYALNPTNLNYFFLPLCAVAVFFLIIYYPRLKAAKGAKKVARLGGTYKVSLSSDGYLTPTGEAAIALSGDKNARAFETDGLFVIRPDSQHTFCFPKRCMSGKEIALTRETLESKIGQFKRITGGGEA